MRSTRPDLILTMSKSTFHTPVAFMIFNRPEKTARVFAEIRKARPTQLFIVADGPRTEQEKEKTDATRAVTEHIDWECEVKRNYSDVNVGCKMRVSSGISWIFENVENAIILEDDCVPEQSFFPYCQELLERYKDDTRIMHISGDNFEWGRTGNFESDASYYFSRIPHVWGWATWRRAWNLYDINMTSWPECRRIIF